MTVPLIGWTARSDSPGDHPYDCGFKVSKYGAQQSTDPLGHRLRQRGPHQWLQYHRQRPHRYQHGDRPCLRHGLDQPSHREIRRPRRAAASPTTTSTTSRCCGTAPIATCIRSPPPTTKCATGHTPMRRRSRLPIRPRRRSARCCGGGAPISTQRLMDASTGADYTDPQQHLLRALVSPADEGLRAAARRAHPRLSGSPLLPAGRRCGALAGRQCRHPGAAPALHPVVVGPHLHR